MNSDIFRSTPLRVAAILGATFFAALIVAGLIAFELIENELNQRMDQSIADTFKVISQSYGENDTTDLVDSIASHALATLNFDGVYALAAPDGHIIAGNIATTPAGNGWLTLPKTALGITSGDDGKYRVFVGLIGNNRLIVGASFAQTTEIANLTLTSVGWASLAILVLVFAIGIALAVRAQRRIDGIAQTMARVGHGEIAARIPVGTRGDDIDLLARQVNAALDRLAGLVEGMQQVSVNIAHDLKTPLNRLAITLEAAIAIEAAAPPLDGLLAQADAEAKQISATFDALLRIAQIEAGARKARFVPVPIGEVLDKIADVYADVADERGQTLTVVCEAPLAPIEGDRDLLTQLCANLVENSIRHCPPNTQIRVAAAHADHRVLVTFSDTGPGIPSDEQGKVFQRLYRVEKSRTTPGSGLGLSLVKAIADLHNAEVSIGNNNPGLWIAISFPMVE